MMGMTVILGSVAVLALLWMMRPSKLDRETSRAMQSGSVEGLVAKLREAPDDTRHTAFNRAVKRLWDGYERNLAVTLIKRMAAHVASSSIVQYWIQHALEVEPDLAKREFDADFLVAYYKPEVAAQCGKVG